MSKKPISNITATLTSVVERIENLEMEKKTISDDIKDIYQEAKGNGLNIPKIKEMIKLRKMDADKRTQEEFTRDVYLKALGLVDDLS